MPNPWGSYGISTEQPTSPPFVKNTEQRIWHFPLGRILVKAPEMTQKIEDGHPLLSPGVSGT